MEIPGLNLCRLILGD